MNLLEGVKRIRSKTFMEAVAAGCAMIAYADGFVQPEEIAKFMDYLRIDERLKLFDANQAIETFNKFVEDFEFDLRVGREKAIRTIRKINKDRDEARLLILVCCAVGKSDEKFSEAEIKVIRDMCMILGLNPSEFDLNQPAGDLRTTADIINSFESNPKPLSKELGIPDWMKKTKTDASSKQEQLPEWMRMPSKKSPSADRKKHTDSKQSHSDGIPEWMRK